MLLVNGASAASASSMATTEAPTPARTPAMGSVCARRALTLRSAIARSLHDLADGVERVDLLDPFVRPEPHDPRETERVARGVSLRRLHLVERHLDHLGGLDEAQPAEVADRVCEEPLRHLRDLFVGEAGVRLANVEQLIAVAHRERVVGEHAPALSVAPLHR